MRFRIISIERAQRKSKDLKALLSAIGVEATLTQCQASLSRCLGYSSWSEMKGEAGRDPSPFDEDAGLDIWRSRILNQCSVLIQDFDLIPEHAAGVAKALRPTGMQRSDAQMAELTTFLPRPRMLVDASLPSTTAEVCLYLQQWEEIEPGWGSRPDGYTVHASAEAAQEFANDYKARISQSSCPDYSRPCSELVRIGLPPDHPAALSLARGETWLSRSDSAAVDAIWPRNAGGWVSLVGGGSGRAA